MADTGMSTADWHAVGIPMSEVREQDWSADLLSATVIDFAAGHPMEGVSPWPTSR